MYELRLEIPMLPDSTNVALRSHWRKQRAKGKRWDHYIRLECLKRMPAAPLVSARIEITRHAHRMLDFDGLVGSIKPVVDAIVSAGILADDSWKVTGAWKVDQKFRPKKDGPLLSVSITEVSHID